MDFFSKRLDMNLCRASEWLNITYRCSYEEDYQGTILHHLVRDKTIAMQNLKFPIAFLLFAGCDFYHCDDSAGNAACYLLARRCESFTIFSQLQSIVIKLSDMFNIRINPFLYS